MSQFGQPPLAALLPLKAGQNLADLPDKPAALANLGTLSTSDIMLNSVPIGTIIPFWGNTAPVGYLPCNGQTVNSGTFPDLVAFLGGGSSQALPDLRGEFLRGWDNGRGTDLGRAIKTAQAAQTEDHTHVTPVNDVASGLNIQNARGTGWPYGSTSISVPGTNTITTGVSYIASAEDSWLNTSPNIKLTAGETRPRNISVLYCMKAYGALVNTSTANIGNVLTELSQCTKLTQFGSSAATAGYQKLPSGVIIQWGSAVSSGTAANNVTITFPIAFPTGCLNLIATASGAISGSYTVLSGATTLTTANATAASSGAISTGVLLQWLAIGY